MCLATLAVGIGAAVSSIGSGLASAGTALFGSAAATSSGVLGLSSATNAAASGGLFSSLFTPTNLFIASTGLAAAQMGLGYASQQSAAEAQEAAARAVAANAEGSYRTQQVAITQRLLQQRAQNLQESELRSTQAAQAEARARTSAAEAGVSGLNLDAVVGDVRRQAGQGRDAIAYNQSIASLDATNQELNAYYQMVDRRNSMPLGAYPSILSPVLGVAGSALENSARYGLLDQAQYRRTA